MRGGILNIGNLTPEMGSVGMIINVRFFKRVIGRNNETDTAERS